MGLKYSCIVFHTWENYSDVNYNQKIACVIYALKRKTTPKKKKKHYSNF